MLIKEANSAKGHNGVTEFDRTYTPYIGDDGVWRQVVRPVEPGSDLRPALFLDRDGVVMEDRGYVHNPEDVHLIDGAAEVISAANLLGFPVVLVTNQGGIALGYFGWAEFARVQDRLFDLLAAGRATVDGVFANPYHPRATGPLSHPDHPARKPNPGMLTAAAEWLDIDLGRSWIVGDHASDLLAGRNAGLAGGMHVLTGHGSQSGERDKAVAVAAPGYQVIGAGSIAAAMTRIPLLAED